MTLKECYQQMDANYDEVMARLRSERLVQKFVLKFLDDKTFASLTQGIAARDQETAFRAAHTMKGMCQNLSFTRLGHASEELTEALRHEFPANAQELYDKVAAEYGVTAAAITALRDSQ